MRALILFCNLEEKWVMKRFLVLLTIVLLAMQPICVFAGFGKPKANGSSTCAPARVCAQNSSLAENIQRRAASANQTYALQTCARARLHQTPGLINPAAELGGPPWDEQLVLSFPQNWASNPSASRSAELIYSVDAVAQTDSSGYGPAYLLNGLTDQGYWYQVGVCFCWPESFLGIYYPDDGFHMIYEVWDPSGTSIFPSNGGVGVDDFTGNTVNIDDMIYLELYISSGQVVMDAIDRNAGAIASETYSAEGANQFIGTNGPHNAKGFFSGLMTEWYHDNPYYGNESEVDYAQYFNGVLSSAYMYIDEYNPSTSQVLFSGGKLVSYSAGYAGLVGYYLEGATEYSDAFDFVTGAVPLVPITFSYSVQGGGSGYGSPTLTCWFCGVLQYVSVTSLPITFSMDQGTNWTITNLLSGSSTSERWQTNQQTSKGVFSPQTFNIVYYHQFFDTLSYSVVGGGSPAAPILTYYQFGKGYSWTLTTSAAGCWLDAGSTPSLTNPLGGSSSSERWALQLSSYFGLFPSVSSSLTIIFMYYHQF
jgi:hypothetical protein